MRELIPKRLLRRIRILLGDRGPVRRCLREDVGAEVDRKQRQFDVTLLRRRLATPELFDDQVVEVDETLLKLFRRFQGLFPEFGAAKNKNIQFEWKQRNF
jgi:hypothetical protein